MTRDELDNLAAFLRARLGAPTSADPAAPKTVTGALRTVEQAVLGLEAFFQLAARVPTTPGLSIEEQRAQALWQTLLEMAARWPDHPDSPLLSSTPPDPGPPPAVTAA
ncbi:hypothetical protein [Streptacidiphilus fuscans]|uniref:Uncharacterized protein n=1 Tax=Streptacidiphilus fuscans TaxID=2789292 RepID=A0A931FEE6_9ACTN|nr:hypothetical protein [Streptacidiphilus fuscans]MBF9069125.1 hypothetical protein [Streptacidiphilus fuscans]